jgi:hypothetical protein
MQSSFDESHQISRVSVNHSKNTATVSIRIPIALQTVEAKELPQPRKLIRLTIFPLMRYVYANKMQSAEQDLYNILDVELGRGGIDNWPGPVVL